MGDDCEDVAKFRATQKGHIEKLAALYRERLTGTPKPIELVTFCSPDPAQIHPDVYAALGWLIENEILEETPEGLFRATQHELVHRYRELIRSRMTIHPTTENELLGLNERDPLPAEAMVAIHQQIRDGELEEVE